MAAAKKAPAVDPLLRIHPVALELSKAGAAVWLLDQLHTGELSPVARRPAAAARREPEMLYVHHLALEEGDVRSWLETVCIDMIADALRDGESALGGTVGQDARTAAVGAPAPDVAR